MHKPTLDVESKLKIYEKAGIYKRKEDPEGKRVHKDVDKKTRTKNCCSKRKSTTITRKQRY